MNATLVDELGLVPLPVVPAAYHSTGESALPFASDITLSVVAPIVAYWAYSAFFHVLDELDLLPHARIHPPAEIARRNRATRLDVVRAVVVQQVLQMLMAYFWLAAEGPEQRPSHADAMRALAPAVARVVLLVLGDARGLAVLRLHGAALVSLVYWWLVPAAQLVVGMLLLDTWQYFLHRGMHMNRFLYRHLHSVHHRLYVPYSYGALYNHPIEGFILDTVGGALAQAATGMNVRQAAFFFTVSTMKTVDDHCGYRLPLDPFQLFFANTADYHDIHHQHAGIKYNFSQPFFIHWDSILGTRMRRDQFRVAAKKVPEKEL